MNELKQADARATRDAVQLDRQSAALELAEQRAQELMSAACRRRRELVEEREVGTALTPHVRTIDLGPELARDGTDARDAA